MLALTAGMKRVECVGFSPDGTRLAVGGSGLEVWKVPEYRTEWRWEPSGGALRSVWFGHDRQTVLGLIPRVGLLTFDCVNGKDAVYLPHRGPSNPAFASVDAPGTRAVVSFESHLACWVFSNLGSGQAFSHFKRWVRDTPWQIPSAAAFVPGRDEVVALAQFGRNRYSNVLHVFAAGSGEPRSTFCSAYGHVDELVASPDGAWLAARRGSVLLVWDANRLHKVPLRLETESRRHLTGLAFHPSGRWLATASNDKSVRLWDVGSWAVTRSFTWEAGRMRSVAFAPDGLTAAAGGEDGRFVVFDVDG